MLYKNASAVPSSLDLYKDFYVYTHYLIDWMDYVI